MGKTSIRERSSRRGLGEINVVPAITREVVTGTRIVSDHNTYQKNRQGHAMCPCFLEVGNRLFHFRRQAIIYLWLLCSIFLSVYLTDFELYLEKGEEST